MSNASALNQAQREQFKTQLRNCLNQAERALREKSAEAHRTALLKVLEQTGAAGFADSYRLAKEAMETAENELESKGFSIRYCGEIAVDSDAPAEVTESYEAFVDEQVGPERDRVRKLEEAISSSWSIATLPEAKQILVSFAQ